MLLAAAALSLLGFHLTFDAEMTAPSDMSQFINSFANGNTTLWNNHEAENYVPYDPTSPANPYAFQNGALVITASPIPSDGLPYTSGMLCTCGIFSQTSGYFEIRATTPAGQGFWPAFWMLPNGEGYPELDIMEQPNNSGADTKYWTHISTPTDNSGGFTNTHVDVTQGFHTYGFMWTPMTIQFVFDGHYIGSPHATPPSISTLAMYMLANLAVGGPGSWPGVPLQGATSTYSIDYIRAFSLDPTVATVSQEPISSPDGVDTTPQLLPPPPPVPRTMGSGSDTLVLNVAEDAYEGNAKFTLAIDGKQRGGTLTARAANAYGQNQAFTIRGNFGALPHSVTVDFLNNANGLSGDRNLYVNGGTINGVPITSAHLAEYASGPQSFNFKGNPPAPVTIGQGPDQLLLGMSQDAFNGNARYTISVDGVEQGGVQSAAAAHGDGQSQSIAVLGTFGPQAHNVSIRFRNGAPPGSNAPDRNLYLDSMNYDGWATPNGSAAMLHAGVTAITVPATGPDTLVVQMTEDAWQGDAQAQILLDGKLLDTVTVTAPNSSGQPQLFTYAGNFGGTSAPHRLIINYLNDAYLAPGEDRNLYVQGATLDGAVIPGAPVSVMRGGPVTFSYAGSGGVSASVK